MASAMQTLLLMLAAVLAVAATQDAGCPQQMQAAASAAAVCGLVEAGIALGRTHSHNTYDHPKGLREALATGYCSVEADFFYNGSSLFIAHDQDQIRPDWTMQSKYLDPLLKVVRANGGTVYPASHVFGGCPSIILLCDAKEYNNDTSEAAARRQFDALHKVLNGYQARYPGLFSVYYRNGTIVQGAINVYVSGLRPSPDYVAAMDARPLALDGRVLENLNGTYGPSVYPLVSQGFDDICPDPAPPDNASLDAFNSWQTKCMVKYEKKIQSYIDTAHQQQKIIRFWATVDTPQMWDLLISAQVDLVNVDALYDFRTYAFEKWGTRGAMYNYEKRYHGELQT